MKLYEIANSIRDIFRNNTDPETGQVSEEAFVEISNLELDAVSKIHSCGNVLRKMRDKIDSITNLERELRKKKNTLKKDYENLEKYTAYYMDIMGIDEVFKDGLEVKLNHLPDDLKIEIPTLLESAPEFVKVSSRRAMIRDLKNHIFKNKGKIPNGVKVITNRLGLKL